MDSWACDFVQLYAEMKIRQGANQETRNLQEFH
jgi:hypothetical protein